MPKISVILTSYNHAPFIREAIESVLAQTFEDFELIIWDDNSTDSSWEIIQSYADPRIRSFRNAVNMGPVFGINKSILEVATGEFIAMHHSDDVWVAEKLAKQVACFEANPHVAAVFSYAQAIAEEGFELDDDDHYFSRVFDQPNRPRHQWLRHFFDNGNALCHPSVLIRRASYLKCGVYSDLLWQLPDFDMWFRLLLEHDIHILPERLVKFRVLDAEANTSGNRPDSRIQWAYEFPRVLGHLRTLKSFTELCNVFPEAEQYDRGADTDLQFALSRTALDLSVRAQNQIFALELMRALFVDLPRREKIAEHYGFGLLDFIGLTRRYDVYSREVLTDLTKAEQKISQLNTDIAGHKAHISQLNQAISTLQHSLSWRLSAPVRWAGGGLKTLPGLVRSLFQLGRQINAAGGIKFVARRAWALYEREGLSGIKRGFGMLERPPNPDVGSGQHDRNDYQEWVRRYDTLDETRINEIRGMVAGLANKPCISIILPTYKPKQAWLRQAIDSVRNQIYPHWELCIADDATPGGEIKALLEEIAAEEPRIKVVYRPKNGHIAAASNSALELATGDWIALLDHDDLLAPHALAYVASQINLTPQAGLIYSDEDKINKKGQRCSPYFKSDWNPALFLSQNMVNHLGVYRRDLVQQLGGFRTGVEGAQDYDLATRLIEHLQPTQIVHIPHVLYHWRIHAESTSMDADSKTYAQDATLKVLKEHFARTGVNAYPELVDTHCRIHYQLPENLPKVSLIIPTRNAVQLVRQCIESIVRKTTYTNYEILLIDNGSDDPEALAYFRELNSQPGCRVIRDDRPFNYSALNNTAVATAEGELVCLVNNDIEVISPDWLGEMVGIALQPGVGAVGACLWYPDDTLQHGGVVIGLGGVAGHSHKFLKKDVPGYFYRGKLMQNFSAVTAACLLVKKSIYQQVGGLNEKNLPVAFNDVDFCLKVQAAGYRNVWTPYAELYHHESATRGKEDTPEKQERAAKEIAYMQRRWKKIIGHDPAYSPNLTINHEDFSLAWPPRA